MPARLLTIVIDVPLGDIDHDHGLTGLYYLSNTNATAVAQDANSLAVLYGVAPASDDATLLAALKTDHIFPGQAQT